MADERVPAGVRQRAERLARQFEWEWFLGTERKEVADVLEAELSALERETLERAAKIVTSWDCGFTGFDGMKHWNVLDELTERIRRAGPGQQGGVDG